MTGDSFKHFSQSVMVESLQGKHIALCGYKEEESWGHGIIMDGGGSWVIMLLER